MSMITWVFPTGLATVIRPLVPTFTVYVFHREVSPPHVRARGRDLEPHHVESVQRALEAGVKLGAGTDAGGHQHHINARELECMV